MPLSNSKVKVEMEFEIHSSPHVLYEYVSSPARLLEWFCDKIDYKGDVYDFYWEGEKESAKILSQDPDRMIRYQWLYDDKTSYYLEFRIVIDDLTKDVSLVIIDFSEESEVDENKMYWQNSVEDLKHALGAT